MTRINRPILTESPWHERVQAVPRLLLELRTKVADWTGCGRDILAGTINQDEINCVLLPWYFERNDYRIAIRSASAFGLCQW